MKAQTPHPEQLGTPWGGSPVPGGLGGMSTPPVEDSVAAALPRCRGRFAGMQQQQQRAAPESSQLSR